MARPPLPPKRRRNAGLPKASSELSVDEIRDRYGDLVDEFVLALRTDSAYLAWFAQAVMDDGVAQDSTELTE